ncbi:hypothetical protein [Streptomyces sp. GbtcB6]|uniref:hypothetical protein n=1 Tax=Streptomyces sp. GbtcB6 TaxID=2824751 RepID=UPI001C2F2845|nr:hypothetical protein [Streptomyces sp. GbtcB6]
MEILLRTALAPCLVLLVSAVARRSGPRPGGLLLGLPMTSVPFVMLLWLNTGIETAARAARGLVAAQLAVACFCLAYGRLAPALRPARALLVALAGTAAAAVAAATCPNVWLTAAAALAVTCAGLGTWPAPPPAGRPSTRVRRGREVGTRMAVSAATVPLALTAARALGPFAAGVLAAFPVLLAVMAPAVHRTTGAQAAAVMMRAALTVVPGTLAFLLLLCTAL